MKSIQIILLILSNLLFLNLRAQELQAESPKLETTIQQKKSTGNKGRVHVFWGWNRSNYTTSDITFKGNDYNFTLYDVVAKDRQSPFSWKRYFHPEYFTTPQYNFRCAYFITDKWEISYGIDHMKYVMVEEQIATLDGEIANSGTVYDGTYNNQDFKVNRDFLLYEHSDGLNYVNIESRRFDVLFEYKKFRFNHFQGAGLGVLLPKTNATLLNNKRHDDFHFSGLGANVLVGINLEFYRRFFIQGELKAGYCNMPSIRTTNSKSDNASQQFSYVQYNFSFGINFNKRNRNLKNP